MSEQEQIIGSQMRPPAWKSAANLQGPAQLPEHLLPLPGSAEWALWRCAALRGAGFPAARVLRLTATAAAAAADELLAAETEAEQARADALEVLGQALDKLKSEQKWESKKQQRIWLLSQLRLVKAGKLLAKQKPAPSVESEPENVRALTTLRAALERVERARRNYDEKFQLGLTETSEIIRGLAEDERFREAVTWQNRHALHGSIDALLRMPATTRDAERRKREELVANYVQRYCVKNDTIGFFGPVGWARLNERAAGLRVQPGVELLAQRTVYFEGWCIDALIARLNRNRALRPWIAPRLLPFMHLESDVLHLPFKKPLRLPAQQAALLRACDGERTAREIAGELLRMSAANGLRNEAEVYPLLEACVAQGLIAWELGVPLEEHPERRLRQLLERIEDDGLRSEALQQLDELTTALAAVARATGNAAELDQAIEQLEARFTRLTGQAATREPGKIYAARTLVYEDCRRDVEVEIGQHVLQELGPPLALLLQSARWLTYQLAAVMRRSFKEIYNRLASQSGNRVVDGVSFWMQAQPILFGKNVRALDELSEQLQRRWANVLNLEPGQRQRDYRSEELREKVAAAFAAPHAGWPYARYHSPDVMIAAASAEAVQRGEYQFVLGEMHLALNTLSAGVQVAQHPAPEQLFHALETDLPETRLVSVPPKEWETLTTRTRLALVAPKDYRLIFGNDPAGVPPTKAVPIGSLVVEERGGELIVRTRDHRLAFNIIEALADALSNLVVDHFKLLRPQGHTPRVTIDKLIIAREAWHFPPPALAWAHLTEEAARFLAARRWAQQHALPTRVFVKVPVEAKPCYVDFSSPVLVNVLAKLVRRTVASAAEGMVQVTEMKPEVEEVWLADGAGAQYTAELRLVALDLTKP